MDSILGRVVAAILGLLALGGVIYAGGQALGGNKVSQMTNDVAQVVNNARSQMSQNSLGYTNFTTANTAPLITAGIFPADMNRGGVIVDAWGNAVTFAPIANGQQFTLTWGGAGMTADQCSKLASSMQGYISLKVNATTWAIPPDAVAAGTACGGGTTFVGTFQ